MEFALLGEDPAEYTELKTQFFAHHRPVGLPEEVEVERIVDLWWKLKRAKRYETAMIRVAVRDFGRREIARQEEHCHSLDLSEESLIRQLREAEKEITTTGRVPADIDQKLAPIRLVLEVVWSQIETKAREEFQKMCRRRYEFEQLSPEEYSAKVTWLTIVGVLDFLEEQQKFRFLNTREIAIAEHIIPVGPSLDNLVRYETSIERNLSRALDRLQKLQRTRNNEDDSENPEN